MDKPSRKKSRTFRSMVKKNWDGLSVPMGTLCQRVAYSQIGRFFHGMLCILDVLSWDASSRDSSFGDVREYLKSRWEFPARLII
jgi:hypothetical protein